MFAAFSWSQYFHFLGWFLLLYYALVIAICFRAECLQALRRIGFQRFQPAQAPLEESESSSETIAAAEGQTAWADLFGRLQKTLGTAARQRYPKAELLTALQLDLSNTPGKISRTEYHELVRRLLDTCAHHNYLVLDHRDFEYLWSILQDKSNAGNSNQIS